MFVLTVDPAFSHFSRLRTSTRVVSPSSVSYLLARPTAPTAASGRCMRLKDPIPYCALLTATKNKNNNNNNNNNMGGMGTKTSAAATVNQ